MAEKTFRVLIVEDDAPLRQLLRTSLERSGRFQIVGEAADGHEAIRLARASRPDLILLDLAMPNLGGIEALPSIRQGCPEGKVVALSMLQREQWEQPALAAGAVAFLDKAIPSRELIQRLLRILGAADGAGPQAPGGPSFVGSFDARLWRPRRGGSGFGFDLRNPIMRAADGRSAQSRASPARSGHDLR